jgi:hypothetical protein
MKTSDLKRMVSGGAGKKTKVVRDGKGGISITSIPLTMTDLERKAEAKARRERRAQRLAQVLPVVEPQK